MECPSVWVSLVFFPQVLHFGGNAGEMMCVLLGALYQEVHDGSLCHSW